MQFGDQIQMRRDYDDGRLPEGATYTVGTGDDGITPGLARALCKQAADGEGPYAEKITSDVTDDEEIQIEISPDGNTSGGPTDVIAFTAMPSDYEISGSVGSPQERTTTLEISNGVKPTISSSFST